MWTWLKRLFTDEQLFLSVVSLGGARLWAIIIALSGIVATGAIPEVTTALGRFGAWGSYLMIGLAIARAIAAAKLAETPPAAKAMAHIEPDHLAAVLRQLGVPMGVAAKAAEKTAETAPPKV